MPQAKQLPKRRSSSQVATALGAAGWLTLASGASTKACRRYAKGKCGRDSSSRFG
jgi:hypothetical protein